MKKGLCKVSSMILVMCLCMGLCFSSITPTQKVEAKSTASTITVNKASKKLAKKIHKKLVKGKKFKLKVKGGEKTAKKRIKKLYQYMGRYNGVGATFQYKSMKKQGNYTVVSISKDNCKLYKYSIQFFENLYQQYQEKTQQKPTQKDARLQDKQLYPDLVTRQYRIIYDNIVRDVMEKNQTISRKYIDNQGVSQTETIPGTVGATPATTVTTVQMVVSGCYISSSHNLVIKSKASNGQLMLYSFDEFKLGYTIDYLLKIFIVPEVDEQTETLKTQPFYKLSEAMKVLIIGQSGYFSWDGSNGGKGICYNTTFFYNGAGDSKMMKTLVEYKAMGMSGTFASCSKFVFEQLGIKSWTNSNKQLKHAWTVVKAKNSKGKVLWIPFDYGIGPCLNAPDLSDESSALLASEEQQYAIYLAGIPGAPGVKNWVDADFN